MNRLFFLAFSMISATLFAAAATALLLHTSQAQLSSSCEPVGYFKCIENSHCVGISGFAQNDTKYYSSSPNGVEFAKIQYVTEGTAPKDYFLHMQINGGCASKPCAFSEDELYTSIPGNVFNYEGFTVNRTGAVTGNQVFYENLYFMADCNSYVKIVKGQQLMNQASAVMCKNLCQRTTLDDYNVGIQGGYSSSAALES